MSTERDSRGDSYFPHDEEDGEQEARELKNAAEASGQGGSAAPKTNARDTTSSRRLSCIDSQRTGLRREDAHGSWREVYAALDVEVQQHE